MIKKEQKIKQKNVDTHRPKCRIKATMTAIKIKITAQLGLHK